MSAMHVKDKGVVNYHYVSFILIGIAYSLSCLDVINVKIDDVFITLRYARNFLNSNGFVFNIGERIEGFSNPTWLLLVACLAKILGLTGHFPMFYFAKALGFFFGFLNLFVFFRIMKETDNHIYATWSVLFLIAINPFLNTYNVSGLENPFVNFILALVILFYLRVIKKQRVFDSIALSITLGILGVSRPEGIMYPISFYAGMYLILKFSSIKITRNLWLYILITFVILFGFMLCRWFYYNDLFPNTAYAKNNPTLATFKSGLFYVFIFSGLSTAAFVFLCFMKGNSSPLIKSSYLPLCFVLASQNLFAIYAGGDWMPGGRLLLATLPLCYFLILDALSFKGMTTSRAVAFFVVLFIVGWTTWILGRDNIKTTYQNYIPGFRLKFDLFDQQYYDIAQKLSELAKEKDLVLIGEAGFIPYLNDQIRFTDLSGLMDKHIAKNIMGPHGRRLDNDYFLSLNYRYVVAMARDPGWNPTGPNYTGQFSVDALLNDSRFAKNHKIAYSNKNGVIFRKNE